MDGSAASGVLRGGDKTRPVVLGCAVIEPGWEMGQDELAHLAAVLAPGRDQAVGDAGGGSLGTGLDSSHELDLIAARRALSMQAVVITWSLHRG